MSTEQVKPYERKCGGDEARDGPAVSGGGNPTFKPCLHKGVGGEYERGQELHG